ncbi:VOC family protein [Moheibacter sediminis]|uniref:Glyoxalase-like domain-containing protein n=1 Tax=Moheibacter sediminis TaxID=1434700 RepID=A0A1W2AGF2_9FLAO|nr:VOC family protein [Moheibacter sediminis]SMC59660.1 hypothetical protein SAMN06296427_104135 [Moheibacter sediminis]
MEKPKYVQGSINWRDLTTYKADELREFYQSVAGWTSQGLDMKDGENAYQDYVMKDAKGNSVAGICHSRGANTGVPPQWVAYISVENVDESVENALKLGGKLLKEYKSKEGTLFYAMIEDPAGAVFALAKI